MWKWLKIKLIWNRTIFRKEYKCSTSRLDLTLNNCIISEIHYAKITIINRRTIHEKSTLQAYAYPKNIFLISQPKHVVGIQKNHPSDTVPLSIENIC